MRTLAFVVLGASALGALFWLARPPSVEAPAPVPATQPAAPPPTIEIRQGHHAAGPDTVRVTQGETARLRFVSDQNAELHLHGYDLHLHLKAGVAGDLEFVAAHSGRFELELHGGKGAHNALAVVEVVPK